MADKSFWHDVRVRVVAGVILAVLGVIGTHLLGWWPAIEHWIGHAAITIGVALTYQVRVHMPLWFVIVLAIGCVLLARRVLKARPAEVQLQQMPAPRPPQFDPDGNQRGILELLGQLDGEVLHTDTISNRLHVGNLLISQALDGLAGAGLVEPRRGSYGSSAVGLTQRGRDYLIAAGLARKTPAMR